MALEMQQEMMLSHKKVDDDQDNEVQPGTAIEIDSDGESSCPENKSTNCTPRSVFLVLLFNVFLIVAAIPVFLYFCTENKLLKKRVLDFLIVGGALVGIPLLYCLGDMSEGRPNFYYI